jgi:hypothetical protein
MVNRGVGDAPDGRPDRRRGGLLAANPTCSRSVPHGRLGQHRARGRLSLIPEASSVTVARGDEELKERVQLCLTPGASVKPAAEGWNLRTGDHLPVTSAKEVDVSLIAILAKGF